MRIHRLFAVLAVSSLGFAAPALAEGPGSTGADAAPVTAEKNQSEKEMSPEKRFGMMEKEFANQKAKLAALRAEAQGRRDAARLQALDVMEQELKRKHEAMVGEMKAKLGEEGFARAQAKWNEAKAKADRNGDGKVDGKERQAFRMNRGKLDRDGDGKVGPNERKSSRDVQSRAERSTSGKSGSADRERGRGMKSRPDRNGDGSVGAVERRKARDHKKNESSDSSSAGNSD